MKIQATIKDNILIELIKFTTASKAIQYYIQYLKTGKVDSEIIQTYLQSKIGNIQTNSGGDTKLKAKIDLLKDTITEYQNDIQDIEAKYNNLTEEFEQYKQDNDKTYIQNILINKYFKNLNSLISAYEKLNKQHMVNGYTKELEKYFPGATTEQDQDQIIETFLDNI